MISLQDFNYEEIKNLSKELGIPAFRADQLYDMAMQDKDYSDATNIPKDLIAKLAGQYRARAVEVVERLKGRDGAEKYLFKLEDGNIVEGVYMPHIYGDTLCVSTQAGCRMGCAFCASGIGGLVRNLTSGEILGQVLAVNRLNGGTKDKRAVTNVVLMGSGEPLDNYDNVAKFLRQISAPRGINMSQRNISLSTVGLADKMRQLADDGFSVTLTISLHAPTDDKRTELVPMNRKFNIREIIAAAKYYFDKTGRRFIFEYSMIDGKNADAQSAEELSNILRGLPCHVNLIKLNYVKEKGLRGAKDNDIAGFLSVLEKNKISATLRRSMGNDIEGACGQLRRKYMGES